MSEEVDVPVVLSIDYTWMILLERVITSHRELRCCIMPEFIIEVDNGRVLLNPYGNHTHTKLLLRNTKPNNIIML